MITGFFGKLPARGDFVRARLPGAFVDPWDGWLAAGIAASREVIAEGFTEVWAEAPIWRFWLNAGLCGEAAAFGVWMPSVDRANRLFPLSIVACLPPGDTVALPDAAAWLDGAEEAGLAAVTQGVGPEELLGLIDALPSVPVARGAGELASLLWTAGGPRVAARRFEGRALPTASRFAALLDDRFDAESAGVS